MSHGPVLTVAFWDPAHADLLLDRVERAVVEAPRWLAGVLSARPTGPGCVLLDVWLGDLDLGYPDDPPEPWERLDADLTALVGRVRPAVALRAGESGTDGLLDPDRDELALLLQHGWVRAHGIGEVRRERFGVLEARGTIQLYDDGWAWRGADAADAVFWAWVGESGDEARTSTRIELAVPDPVTEADVAAALPPGYEVLGVAGGRAVARPPTWADPVVVRDVDLAEAATLLGATGGRVVETVRGARETTASWAITT